MSAVARVAEESLVGVMADLWASVADAERAPSPEATAWPRASRPVVRGSVEIDGAWRGVVVVTCDEPTGERWARAMLAIDEAEGVSDADVEDVVAEMTNVLGGAVKAQVDGGRLGLPVVSSASHFDERLGSSDVAVGLAWPDAPTDHFTVAVVSH